MTEHQYARPELLASTEWLAERLDDPNVRVVDCDEFDPYLRAHIKNAVGIRVHHYIKHPDYPSNPTQYPLVAEPDVMKSLMEEMGIGDDTLVVVIRQLRQPLLHALLVGPQLLRTHQRQGPERGLEEVVRRGQTDLD